MMMTRPRPAAVVVVVATTIALFCSVVVVVITVSASPHDDNDGSTVPGAASVEEEEETHLLLVRSLEQANAEGGIFAQIGDSVVWIWNLLMYLFFPRPPCYCALPYEYDLCRMDGVAEICQTALIANADADFYITKTLFLAGCHLLAGVQYKLNCDREKHVPYRPGVTECYDDAAGIRVIDTPRGNCFAGRCCNDIGSLCEMEKIKYFITLGYGVDTVGDDTCDDDDNVIAYTYGDDADCQRLTDGVLTNEALVCTNLNDLVADDDINYCHVSFAGTNDIIDTIRELSQAKNPLNERRVDFGNGITFRAAKQIVDIGLGQPGNDADGIIEIVYQNLLRRGCLTSATKAGVHLMGHSLGGLMASLLALKLGALAPTVPVRITTAGEPGILLAPLAGAAAALPAWSRKVRYISGTVLPRSTTWRYIGGRPYGVYQSYDIIPQLGPDMHYVEATGIATQYFACESVQDGRFVYQLRGPEEGCAAGRSDVLNPMPGFPHSGGLQRNTIIATLVRFLVDDVLGLQGDKRRLIDMFTFALDLEMVENFMQVIENHSMIRYVLFFNKLTQNGTACQALGPVRVGGGVGTC